MVPSRGGQSSRLRMPSASSSALCSLCFLCTFEVSKAAGASDADVSKFWQQGYLHLTDFASQSEIAQMRASMAAMIDAWEPPKKDSASGLASLSLRSSASDEIDHSFMLDSSTKASFFVELSALDATTGALRPGVEKRRAIRKVAHALHFTPGPFQDFASSSKIAAVSSALGLRKPAVAQSLYRLGASLGRQGVDRHQDSTMLYTDPPSVLGLWLALEDTDESNGCIRIRPGSHREPIRERLVRRPGAHGSTQLVWEKAVNSTDKLPGVDEFISVKASSGDLIILHGSLEHMSSAGTNPSRTRESVQLHVVDAEAKWSPENWLQYPPDRSFMMLAPPGPPAAEEL